MAGEQATDQNWQNGLTNVITRISYLRLSPKWADLTINFPGHQKSIKAHRWMLALSSPVFEAMMFGPLAEGEVLSLPDDPPEVFEWLLDHLYCDKRNLPNVEMAIEVSKLAHKYQIQELSRICSEYMCQQLNAYNLPLLYNMAYMFEDNAFLERCEKLLPEESDKVLQSNEVSNISLSALKHLLANKKLNPSSGLVVFKCIHTWGKAEFERLAANHSDVEGSLEAAGQIRKEADITPLPHILRQCVESLLPFVDFRSVSVDEILEHVAMTGIFTPEENMSILQGLRGVSGIVLPSCVRPWTFESIVLIKRKPNYIYHRGYDIVQVRNICNIRTSHPIILHQIKAQFFGFNYEGEILCHAGGNVVGRGIFTQNCCTFQKPVNLKPEIEFSINLNTDIHGQQSLSVNAESGGIRITGLIINTVREFLLKFSLLKK